MASPSISWEMNGNISIASSIPTQTSSPTGILWHQAHRLSTQSCRCEVDTQVRSNKGTASAVFAAAASSRLGSWLNILGLITVNQQKTKAVCGTSWSGIKFAAAQKADSRIESYRTSAGTISSAARKLPRTIFNGDFTPISEPTSSRCNSSMPAIG